MYDFGSALFWYKLIFATELIAAECSFLFLLKERDRFVPRAVLSVLGIYAFTFALPVFGYNALYISLLFTAIFGVSLFGLKFCFREKWSVVLFCGIWAYTVQHFSYIIGNYIISVTGISEGSVYEESISAYNLGSVIISLFSYVIVYFLSVLLIRLLFRKRYEIRINGIVLIILSIVSLTIEVVINAVVVYLKVETISAVLLTICYIYDFIACLLTIGLLIFSVLNKSLERDNAVISLMLSNERKNFELRRDKIEQINIMCHDLKHRIRELGEGGYADEKLKKLESAIRSYDSVYHTGSEVLDIILADESEKCGKLGIQFVCVADGSCLTGMDTDHIYSLFDNALSNAIEAVRGVADPDKKYIGLRVCRAGGMISVHVENYFDATRELTFEDGLPLTTKGDEEWHGFGMRSMRRVVDACGGGMSVDINGDLFALNVFIPICGNGNDNVQSM